MEIIIEATDPIGVNTVVGNHIEDSNTVEGDSKTITGSNTKVTVDNLIPPVEAIIIMAMAIIKAEVVVAMMETILDPHGHGRDSYQGHNNYQYHQFYTHEGSQVKQYGPTSTLCGGFNHSPKHCFKGKHDINNLIQKMSLGSSNQHQNGLHQ